MAAPLPVPVSTPSGAAAFPLTRGLGWALTGVATLTMAVSYIDRQVLAAIAPSVQAALNINNEQYGWLQSAFSFAYLVGAPIAGLILDRVGTRIGLLTAVVLWSLVAAGHALAPSFAVLFMLRIALGLGEAPSFSGAAQVVRRVLPPADRSAGFGVLFTGSSIGAVIAAPLALSLDASFGWRGAFIGCALVGAVWIPLWLVLTRARPVREALAIQADPGSAAAPSRLSVLANPAVLRSMLLVLASAPAMMFVLLWFPKYLHATFALSKAELARYVWLPPLFMDVGAVGIGVLASMRERAALRRGAEARPRNAHADLVVIGALTTAALAAVPFAGGPWGAAILGAVTMFGGGAMYGRLTADMISRIRPDQVSTACGFTAATQSLIYIVANPIIGRLTDGYGLEGYRWVLMGLGLVVLPLVLVWLVWTLRQPAPAEEPAPAVASAGQR